jgi:hypothetical protein
MTVLCSGGTSSAKPGFAASLFMGPSAIAALLNNIPTIWALPLAAYIGYLTYDLSTFCSNDPPALPVFTAQDVLDLLNVFNPTVNIPAATKFQDLVGAYLWYQVCQCDAVATPAPPAAPAAPANMPVINPPLNPPVSTNGACYEARRIFRTNEQPFLPGSTAAFNLTPLFMSAPGGLWTAFVGQPQQRAYLIPSGATQYGYTSTSLANGPAAATNADSFAWLNSAGNSVRNDFFHIPAQGATETLGPFALPAGATQVFIEKDDLGGAGNVELDMTLRFYCGSTAPVAQTPCCPPDPIASGLLDQILQMVTLIQRQLAPFAYIASTAHAGLVGDGHIDVQGLIGCIVELTAIPSSVGQESGDPEAVFGAGWINWGGPDGSSAREFIGASPQTSFPAAAGQYTRIGYTLRPNVTATITELRREA